MLFGYASSPSLSRIGLKGASALALLEHLGVLVTLVPLAWRRCGALAPGLLAGYLVTDYPWWERLLLVVFVALGVNALVWLWGARRRQPVLAAWCLLYFAFACVAFFAGAARYLLPLAAPMVLLFVLQFRDRPRVLWLALAVNLVLGLNISFAAYEFARVYAHVAPPPGRPFLVNGEWGFRYYMVARGGQPLEAVSVPTPGEWIVASKLSLAGNYDSLAEEIATPLRSVDLRVRTPLRLVDRHAHSRLLFRIDGAAAVLVLEPAARPHHLLANVVLSLRAGLDAYRVLRPPGVPASFRPPAQSGADAVRARPLVALPRPMSNPLRPRTRWPSACRSGQRERFILRFSAMGKGRRRSASNVLQANRCSPKPCRLPVICGSRTRCRSQELTKPSFSSMLRPQSASAGARW